MSKKQNTAEALHFLDNIKLQFQNVPYKYGDFLDAMKDFKKNRIDYNEVIVRVCEVLNGYPSLVTEFNAFLPQGYYLEPGTSKDGREPCINLHTPDGVSVYPRDYPLREPTAAPHRFRKPQYNNVSAW